MDDRPQTVVIFVDGEVREAPLSSIYVPPFWKEKENAADRLRGATNRAAIESISIDAEVSRE